MILNLTQHVATSEQVEAGVVDLTGEERQILAELLTFHVVPDADTLRLRTESIADYAIDLWDEHGGEEGADCVMIGGAPYLMGPLEQALAWRGVKALYAFSVRESVEKTNPDGSVTKTNVFRHAGFVTAAFPARV